MSEQNQNPLKEITQPFIDLMHAPRALWGINLAYVLEGMVYFGMLGYLTIYCSEFIFQAIDGADEAAHYMVMVLTAGITIAMFFLGMVADKRGVRFALILAFIFMLVGRCVWAGGPTVFGFDPTRPTVVAGDHVTLHVTKVETIDGSKKISEATVLANKPAGSQAHMMEPLDVSAGEGIAPSSAIESKVVRLTDARIAKGEEQEWSLRYGTKPTEAKILLSAAHDLRLVAGGRLSLARGYVTVAKKEEKKAATEEGEGKDDEEPEPEYILRSHWLKDIAAVDTFGVDLASGDGMPVNGECEGWRVSLSEASLVKQEGALWQVKYGGGSQTALLDIGGGQATTLLEAGDTIGITQGIVKKTDGEKPQYFIAVEWPGGFSSVTPAANAQNRDARIASLEAALVPDLSIGEGQRLTDDLAGKTVQFGRAQIVSEKDGTWSIQYGSTPLTAKLVVQGEQPGMLGAGAVVALRDVTVLHGGSDAEVSAAWPSSFAAVNTFTCQVPPYKDVVTSEEKQLIAKSRGDAPEAVADLPADAKVATIAELREMKEGRVNVVVKDASVTYVRNGGYNIQDDPNAPGIAVFVSPFGSNLQIATLIGMLLVVIGYGMYQPAAYAGVRKFTTPKTAAMGFAMLYALMNLGGWLPTFAFLVRDDDYLGLGIPGTFWVYTGFTVIALLVTVFVLSRKTVEEAEASAKAETERIKAEEAAKAEAEKSDDAAKDEKADTVDGEGIRPHMWLFWVGAIVLFLFKGESPWFYSWGEAVKGYQSSGLAAVVVWRWILAVAIFFSPLLIAAVPGLRKWIAKHPLQNAKFAYFIFALIPVQTLFTYNWLVLPPYIKRAFEGWIGEYFEIAANANPILIFIAVPIITALTQKRKVYNMMIIGTFIMAAPAFLLVLGAHWWTLAAYILIMTIGEAMWQPRFLQYAAEIAPEGRTGEYMGVAQLPWFLTKVLVPLLYSGRMMDRYCPAEGPKNTELMWFIFACIAMCSTVLLIFAKGWIGKNFKTKAD